MNELDLFNSIKDFFSMPEQKYKFWKLFTKFVSEDNENIAKMIQDISWMAQLGLDQKNKKIQEYNVAINYFVGSLSPKNYKFTNSKFVECSFLVIAHLDSFKHGSKCEKDFLASFVEYLYLHQDEYIYKNENDCLSEQEVQKNRIFKELLNERIERIK